LIGGGYPANPDEIHLLEQNIDKIYWKWISGNPNAIHLLEKNLDKIDWKYLSRNSNAIHLLKQNLDKINWFYLLYNPSIYIFNITSKKRRMKNLIQKINKYF